MRAQGVSADSVTLPQAIEAAYGARPEVVNAAGQLDAAGVGVRAAYGAFLPTVSALVTGSQFYSQTQQVDLHTGLPISADVTSGSVSLGLNAGFDLFTGLRRGKQITAARATRDADQAALDDARAQARLLATQTFYNALAAAELVAVRRDGVARAEDQLKIAIAKQTTGGGNVSDSLRAVVQLGQAQVGLLAAETQRATAELTLGQVLGRKGRTAALDDSSFRNPSTVIDTTRLTEDAISTAPQVAMADASATAARAQLGATRSGYWPTLSLFGQVGYNGSDALDYQLFQQRQVGLQLSIPIFSQFQQQLAVRRQAVASATAESQAADTRRKVAAQVASQAASLATAAAQMHITQLSAEAARADLRVQLERYRLGSATTLDVLNSQTSVSAADEAALNARFSYLNARAQLEALVGHAL